MHLVPLLPKRLFPPNPAIYFFSTLSPSPHNSSQNPSIHSDSQAYTNLFIQYSKQLHLPHAHHPFDQIPDRTQTQTFNNCRILHARIFRIGFKLTKRLGNSLLDLYSKSGHLSYAKKTFGCLEEQDNHARNSILFALSRWGSPESTVTAFVSMQSCGTRPDQFGFAITVSAVARMNNSEIGKCVHCDIVKNGFDSDPFCQSSLIDMYTKNSCIIDARILFDGIWDPDIVSWTNMIAGYVRIGVFDEAVELFSRMQDIGREADQVLILTVMSACVNLGKLEDARELFRKLAFPNVVAWNAIISGHAQKRHKVEALGLYREMRGMGVKPNQSTLGSVLSAAASLAALDEGRQVHSEVIRLGLDSNVFVASSLINLYAKCCLIRESRRVFDRLCERNVVIWNALLGGYLQNGEPEEVIELLLVMKKLGVKLDEYSFVSAFGACGCLQNLELGRQMHGFMIKRNLGGSLFVGNAVVDMYAKSAELNDANQCFDLIDNKDVVSWNTIIVGHIHNEGEERALRLFRRMRLVPVAPDEVTFASVISACSNLQASIEGKQIHCLSMKYNLSSGLYVGSSLTDFYAKLGDLEAAKKVFSELPEKSVASRNALIAGHVQNNKLEEAFNLFRTMRLEGMEPSQLTLASILDACSGPSGLELGKQLHCHILKSNNLYNDGYLEISLSGMYLMFKALEDANKLFSEMPKTKSLFLWTAIISVHIQNGYSEEAILLFQNMRAYNVLPDESNFACVLRVCADLASLGDGKQIHSLIIQTGFGSYRYTCSALIDMYSKCGDVRASLQVFEETKNKDEVILWNSIITGLAKNGYAEQALWLFREMQWSSVKPDGVTFLGILTACSHAGLVSEGHEFFDLMSKKYDITPRVDHYACMIDILGRVGYLTEAEEFIEGLPFEPDGVIWGTFLAACKTHGDGIRAKRAAEKLVELEPCNSSPYVLLSNIYAASGNWGRVKMMRQVMRETGLRKSPGCSWIVVGNRTSSFFAGDKLHPNTFSIYEILKNLTEVTKEEGYVAELDCLLVDEE